MHKKVVLICLLLLFAVVPVSAEEIWRDGDTKLYIRDPIFLSHSKLADRLWDHDYGGGAELSENGKPPKLAYREIDKDFKANLDSKDKPRIMWLVLGLVLGRGDKVVVDQPGALELIVMAEGQLDTIPDSRIIFGVDKQQEKYRDTQSGQATLHPGLYQRYFKSMRVTAIPVFVRVECRSIQKVVKARPTQHWRVVRKAR